MARVTYVGHATVLIDLDGVRLLTDPVLRPRVLHLRRVGPVAAEALRGLDAVLLSHAHWDHLDLPSVERLGKGIPVVCPTGVAPLLRRKRFAHVTALGVGEAITIGPLTVTGVHAEHDGGRGPLGASGELGFVVSGSRSVYFAGDTDLFDGLAELGPVDVALVPVAGWGAKVGPGHLDPERAAEAVRLLRPRVVVPIHWGTLARVGRTPDTESPHEFARLAPPGVTVRILSPGESLDF
ncbi:MAG TPA: MBL fold metallo-hydrolase [Gaiellaceae bacterium]|nr:MBL fold metallo-hydrolase [Gaiellaceae bacterium]